MAGVRHFISAFLAGEISPLLGGRVDTDQYGFGLQLCENFIPVNEGPLIKRQGFEFIRAADDTASWLTAFRRGIEQEYVIEWGEEKARFFTNDGRIETSPGVAYEIVTPYAAVQAPQLSTQQSFDRLYIDHEAHPPGALRRDSALTFAHEVTTLIAGPLADQNSDEAKTVSVTGTLTVGGTITLNASASIFAAGQIGSPFRLEAKDFSTLKAWEPTMKSVVAGEVVRSDGKAYLAATSGTTGTFQPTHTSGSEWDGQLKNDLLNNMGPYGVQWTYLYDRFGMATITAVASGTSATGLVTRRFPASLGSVASFRWSLGAFSDAAGWPSHVALWSGRIIHLKDFEIIGSVVNDYGGGRANFASHTDSGLLTDDLAFRRAIATEDAPLWLAVDRKLVIGTATREISIGRVNTNQALTGSNISAEPQSYYGSERIVPAQIGTETIFVERGGRRIRSADYDFARDRYDASDLTAAARHITRGGVVQLAYQRIPNALLYAVRGDGQLVVHPKTRSEIKGFSRTVLGGGAQALSAVAVVGADGKTDDLWVLVTRETPGGTVREIWKQSRWREQGDEAVEAFYVDGGVQVAASAGQTVFTGLDHLAGQAVAVLANGGVVPGQTVDNDGVLTLPATAVPATDYTLAVGLAYTAQAISLRPEVRRNGQTSQGLRQNLKKVVVRLLETLGMQVGAGSIDAPTEGTTDRPGNAAMDAAIPLFSGDTEGLVEAEWSRDGGRARWVSADPLPAVIVASILNLEMDEADA